MPEVKYKNLPFLEAIAFFRGKVNMPTERWNDLWKQMHARGFMVAGAMKAELLSDLRGAVDKAVGSGITLAQFQKDFDHIVAKHGWSYKGGRNWRTRVIFETNIRSAYNAGRWQQMTDPEVLALRPYLIYRHGDSIHPRLHHLAWDGLVLEATDPWWKTHYPQNGWGCKCKVFSVSKRELSEMGKDGPDKAPRVKNRDWTDKKTGKTYKVPEGIDPGWDYNVGMAAGNSFKVLSKKFDGLPYDVASAWMASYVKEPVFESFVSGKIQGEFPVAVLNQQLKEQIGALNQTVWLSSDTLNKNLARHKDLSLGEYQKLPEVIDHAQVVVKDGDRTEVFIKRDGRLYHGSVKATKTGDALFLTSFRLTDMADVARVKKKGKVLKDEL